jgi:hypothetical protein
MVGDRLWAGWPGFDSRQELEIFLYSTASSSGDHLASHPVGPRGSSPGVRRLGREADHSPPSSAKVKNGGAIPSLPHTSSWRAA